MAELKKTYEAPADLRDMMLRFKYEWFDYDMRLGVAAEYLRGDERRSGSILLRPSDYGSGRFITEREVHQARVTLLNQFLKHTNRDWSGHVVE